MSDFFYKFSKALFIFTVFFIFIVVLLLFALSVNTLGLTSGYGLVFFYAVYIAGIIPLIFAFWLILSDRVHGDWKFGALVFLLFIIFVYFHYLAIHYALTTIDNFKFLLIVNELILLYVLTASVLYLAAALRHDKLRRADTYEVFQPRFKFLLTFVLLSMFSLYFYESFGVYSGLNIVGERVNWIDFPYGALFAAFLNTGFFPLCFAFWLIYSPLAKGNVYYYINNFFILLLLYGMQVFFVVHYYHRHPDNRLGYWLLEAIVGVLTYLAILISVFFTHNSAKKPPSAKSTDLAAIAARQEVKTPKEPPLPE